jgi:hypothetical protein
MFFCREHYGQEAIRENQASIAEGHLTRIGMYWNSRGWCTSLNKVVIGESRPTNGIWHIIVEEVKNG